MFCIKQLRKKNRILYAAKYLKATREAAKREVEILVKLRRCNQVVTFIEVFQCQFYTILVTEYLPGIKMVLQKLQKKNLNLRWGSI